MKVWVVISGNDYETSDLEEVFDSEEKALEYIRKRREAPCYFDFIEAIEKEVK